MRTFDCLAVDCPILGRRLLEASAGTGKTFAMEHIFVRLILEGKCRLEEILAVTFTRAATRQLKERIQANLLRVDGILQGREKNPFPYLERLIGSVPHIRLLQDALLGFDRALIFTIHGFCARMLQEFALEAKWTQPVLVDLEKTQPLRQEAIQFLKQEIDPSILCSEQMALLLGRFPVLEEMAETLLKAKSQRAVSFQESWQKFSEAIRQLPCIDLALLKEDFSKARHQYKGYKEEMDSQVEWLFNAVLKPDHPEFFRKLLYAKGTIFSFFSSGNKKARAKEVALHAPRFFEEASSLLGPIVEVAASWENILANIHAAWKQQEENLFDRGIVAPDALLSKMRKAIDQESFLSATRRRFQAVMIDEFQDTDQVQWEIFKQVFVQSSHCHTLYLVGDPKQSIYRFRNADIYTYFAAKDELGQEACFSLETNYRSSPSLIAALNTLFSQSCLPLPQRGEAIAYRPVKAGLAISSAWEDGKASLHWMLGSEKELFAYTAQEIQRLQEKEKLSIAVLVRDRYEMEKMGKALQEQRISFFAKSKEPLGQSLTFTLLYEVFEWIASPFHEGFFAIVERGPFSFLLEKGALFWKRHLEENGLSSFFRASSLIRENFSPDLKPILEALLVWEYKEGFSWQALFRFLDLFSRMGIDEGGKKIQEAEEGAVEVMTLHASKGLEFDVVFALGLHSPSKTEDEEESAEKLRLLYVAMTRARYRLYVPWLEAVEGESPLFLLAQGIHNFTDYLQKLSETHSVSFGPMTLTQTTVLDPLSLKPAPEREEAYIPYAPLYIQSFSSLLRHKEGEKKAEKGECVGALPRGKEMGQEMHDLFEGIFSCSEPIWQNEERLSELIVQFLRHSFLSPWKEEIQRIVNDALDHPLFGDSFCLRALKKEEVRAEVEFLYAREEHFMKGFIDLVFAKGGRLYFLDWKTNALENETPEEVMEKQGYNLQAALYKEALERVFQQSIGGAFYAFIRERKWLFLQGDQT